MSRLLSARFAACLCLCAMAACTTYSSGGPGLGFIPGNGDDSATGDLSSGGDLGADSPSTGADATGSDTEFKDVAVTTVDVPVVVQDIGPTTVCGNGVCEAGETVSSCPMDCKAPSFVCGNGQCETGETQANCPADCKPATWVCGNGVCEAGETPSSCPADCTPKPVCGNGICESGETQASCAADCTPKPVCGNGICESGETAGNCAADCKAKTVCGNGVCESGENPTCALDCNAQVAAMLPCVKSNCGASLATCLANTDCTMTLNEGTACATKCGNDMTCLQNCLGTFSQNASAKAVATCALQAGCLGGTTTNKCGNGVCDTGETASSCPADCKPATVCGNGKCETGETAANCAVDCGVPVSGCGNGVCDNGETPTSCALDCNTQIAPMVSCVKSTCPTQYSACMVDSACVTAADAAMTCLSKCATSDIMCMFNCQSAGGANTTFSALTQCGLTCFLAP